MARIAVVSYPVLDKADLDWIESLRAPYDPQAGRIPPHFTLVFPVDAPEGITGELARVTSRHAPIALVIRSAIAMPDVADGRAHVFLVPDEGRERIARLHDELYAGALRPHLREDMTFVPHVTIAAGEMSWCAAYAQRVRRTLRPVRGAIASATLLDVTSEVEPIAQLALGAPS